MTRDQIPSAPRSNVLPDERVYDPVFADVARALCWHGATDDELAAYFGVSTQTIDSWKSRYREFLESLKAGKDAAQGSTRGQVLVGAVTINGTLTVTG
jgi:hypothetical protein